MSEGVSSTGMTPGLGRLLGAGVPAKGLGAGEAPSALTTLGERTNGERTAEAGAASRFGEATPCMAAGGLDGIALLALAL
eukprot:1605223-Alexandrium_andersonii.AAC.1